MKKYPKLSDVELVESDPFNCNGCIFLFGESCVFEGHPKCLASKIYKLKHNETEISSTKEQ